jgi:hypothetical protein
MNKHRRENLKSYLGEGDVFPSYAPSNKEPELFSHASHIVEMLPRFVDNVINFAYHSDDAKYRNVCDGQQKLPDAFTECEDDPRPEELRLSALHTKLYGYVKRRVNISFLQMQNWQQESLSGAAAACLSALCAHGKLCPLAA